MTMIRLSEKEIQVIKNAVHAIDSHARVYLFGSRVDPDKKGGDIDLLVLSKTLKSSDKWKILSLIFKSLEEQKIDMIICSDLDSIFTKIALKTAVEL